MRLHREAPPTILLILALCIADIWLSLEYIPLWVAWPVVIASLLLLGVVLWFFRVPMRPPVSGPSDILSPCDGKVVVVEEVQETEYFHDKRVQVSIFMSPLNVHVNYCPVAGSTVYRKYHPGKYLVAWHPKSSTDNERCTVVLRDPMGGEVLVRQIAGALARRICTYPKVGDTVEQGGELGFIKFGSRVDVLLPVSAVMNVKIGDIVLGATTIIARTNPRP